MVVKGPNLVNAGDRSRRWVYGINAVERRLQVCPGSVRELLVLGRSGRLRAVAQIAAAAGVVVRETDRDTLRRLSGTRAHQGCVAATAPFRYQELADVITHSDGPLLVLDQVQDPQNLGALIRTAAAMAMGAVVLPRNGAAGVTGTVEKVAAGAVNDIPLCRVANVSRVLAWLGKRGYWRIGLVPRGGEKLNGLRFPEPLVLVIGGEGGMRRLVGKGCDQWVTIGLAPEVDSLNMSVAGAIAMYEIRRGEAG